MRCWLTEEAIHLCVRRMPPGARGPSGVQILIGEDAAVAQLEAAGVGHTLGLGILFERGEKRSKKRKRDENQSRKPLKADEDCMRLKK